MVASRPGTLRPTSAVALRLAVLREAAVEQDEELKVHVRTAEVMARVSVLEKDAIVGGESAWVHLRLAEPIAAVVGDRVVVRRPSPSETLGGGVIADVAPVRTRRRDAIVALERRSAPTPLVRLLASLDIPRTPSDAAERSGLDARERDAAVHEGLANGEIVALGDALAARAAFRRSGSRRSSSAWWRRVDSPTEAPRSRFRNTARSSQRSRSATGSVRAR